MVEVTSPLPDGVDIGALIGGKFYSYNHLAKPDGTLIDPATSTAQAGILNAINALGAALVPTDPASGAGQAAAVTMLQTIATLLTNAAYYPTTQAISATALPLPNGAATATAQTNMLTALNSVITLLTTPPTQAISATALPLPNGAATASAQAALLSAIQNVVSLLTTPPTQAVTVAALPLPNGAATASGIAANTAAVNATASADDIFAITPSDSTDLATVPKALYVTNSGTLSVRGSGGTTVSLGTVAAGQVIPLRVRRVLSTNTTATVVGLA